MSIREVSRRMFTSINAIALLGVTMTAGPSLAAPPPTWSQWGGPTGDFKVDVTDLANKWPTSGPLRLWTRPLGDGYSPFVGDSSHLYTMYRDGAEEVVVALQADTGKTVWEHRYRATPDPSQSKAYGQGPNGSPLIDGQRVYTVGFTGQMYCLDRTNGKPIWSHDLVKDFNSKPLYYGFASSPVLYRDTVIVPVGGSRYGAVALKPQDGTMVWGSKPYDISYAAPVLINVDGQDQFVFFSPDKVIGLGAKDGSSLWSHPVVNFCKTNCTSVIWGEDNLLWAATKGVGGTRVLKLAQKGGKTSVEEVWLKRKVRLYHWNAVRLGDYVYTAIGDSRKRLSGINVKTGETASSLEGFDGTNTIVADGKLIILDHTGKLALMEPSDGKLTLLSSVQLWDSVSWTPPTLIGTKLYVRDRNQIMALELAKTKEDISS